MTIDNLTTDGSEFTLPNGRRYRGGYHIHVTQGPMVGGKHTTTPHDKLTPINSTVAERVASIQQQLRGQQANRNKIQSTRATVRISSSPPPMSGGGGSSGGGGY